MIVLVAAVQIYAVLPERQKLSIAPWRPIVTEHSTSHGAFGDELSLALTPRSVARGRVFLPCSTFARPIPREAHERKRRIGYTDVTMSSDAIIIKRRMILCTYFDSVFLARDSRWTSLWFGTGRTSNCSCSVSTPKWGSVRCADWRSRGSGFCPSMNSSESIQSSG